MHLLINIYFIYSITKVKVNRSTCCFVIWYCKKQNDKTLFTNKLKLSRTKLQLLHYYPFIPNIKINHFNWNKWLLFGYTWFTSSDYTYSCIIYIIFSYLRYSGCKSGYIVNYIEFALLLALWRHLKNKLVFQSRTLYCLLLIK